MLSEILHDLERVILVARLLIECIRSADVDNKLLQAVLGSSLDGILFIVITLDTTSLDVLMALDSLHELDPIVGVKTTRGWNGESDADIMVRGGHHLDCVTGGLEDTGKVWVIDVVNGIVKWHLSIIQNLDVALTRRMFWLGTFHRVVAAVIVQM